MLDIFTLLYLLVRIIGLGLTNDSNSSKFVLSSEKKTIAKFYFRYAISIINRTLFDRMDWIVIRFGIFMNYLVT